MIRIKRKNEFGRSLLLAKTWNKESYREAVSYIPNISAGTITLFRERVGNQIFDRLKLMKNDFNGN